jgi:hypothetical protein
MTTTSEQKQTLCIAIKVTCVRNEFNWSELIVHIARFTSTELLVNTDSNNNNLELTSRM